MEAFQYDDRLVSKAISDANLALDFEQQGKSNFD
jgi:hypothetical protein